MRFQLPQFIETEVKIVGPFTLRQFLWLAVGAALIYVIYLSLGGGFFFVLLATPIVAIFGSMAFVSYNGAPLFNYVVYGFNYLINPKKYIYTKDQEA